MQPQCWPKLFGRASLRRWELRIKGIKGVRDVQGALKKKNNTVLYLFLDIGCVLFVQLCLTLCNLMDLYFIVILYNLQVFTILVYLLSILSLKTKQKSSEKEFSVEEKGEVGLWTSPLNEGENLKVGKTGKEEAVRDKSGELEVRSHTGYQTTIWKCLLYF